MTAYLSVIDVRVSCCVRRCDRAVGGCANLVQVVDARGRKTKSCWDPVLGRVCVCRSVCVCVLCVWMQVMWCVAKLVQAGRHVGVRAVCKSRADQAQVLRLIVRARSLETNSHWLSSTCVSLVAAEHISAAAARNVVWLAQQGITGCRCQQYSFGALASHHASLLCTE